MNSKVEPHSEMTRLRRSTIRQKALYGFWIATAAGTMLAAPPRRFAVHAQTPFATTNDARTVKSLDTAYRPYHDRDGLGTLSGVATDDKVRVLVRSYETAAIAAEVNARITRLPEREGDRFSKGDILVEFDCRKIITEHDAATAVFKAHEAIYENQRQMLRYRAAGTHAVDQARFEMEKAMADVAGLYVKRTGCTVVAPFDGRVTEKAAQVHEIAQPNQPLIKIINESKLELVLMVPSAWLGRVTEAVTFTVKIDETGESHDARIVQSTGLIDPVSQSARFIAELQRPASTVLPGMSGTAVFARREGSP